jgi:hypothetical protein
MGEWKKAYWLRSIYKANFGLYKILLGYTNAVYSIKVKSADTILTNFKFTWNYGICA